MPMYHVDFEKGHTAELERHLCKNEGRELHSLLKANLDLIPGDQIDQNDPRRWMLVKHEMPVPSPASGKDHWSIDFLIADQDGIPTFVECKRRDDTRSRREVVAQMIEYAANGSHYWEKGQLRDMANQTAVDMNTTLEASLDSLLEDAGAEDSGCADQFFQDLHDNLSQGKLRLVFFLEQAPSELKSMVEFLNRQMELTDVLLVEAEMFKHGEDFLVSPRLFGYTEEARRIKRKSVRGLSGPRVKWTDPEVLAAMERQLPAEQLEACRKVREMMYRLGDVKPGGSANGTLKLHVPACGTDRCLLNLTTEGKLSIKFHNLESVVPELARELVDMARGYGWEWEAKIPYFKPSEWMSDVDRLVADFEALVTKHRTD